MISQVVVFQLSTLPVVIPEKIKSPIEVGNLKSVKVLIKNQSLYFRELGNVIFLISISLRNFITTNGVYDAYKLF